MIIDECRRDLAEQAEVRVAAPRDEGVSTELPLAGRPDQADAAGWAGRLAQSPDGLLVGDARQLGVLGPAEVHPLRKDEPLRPHEAPIVDHHAGEVAPIKLRGGMCETLANRLPLTSINLNGVASSQFGNSSGPAASRTRSRLVEHREGPSHKASLRISCKYVAVE
eukprot:CAMPEP_0176143928 /NCGR_PEP_ID=MMETSP0120_2-20121206/73263_1 /TAXON_ID=160619 /ORGANISM="Kryptoperidinium foliaceum, Strain CCMP 1326" /LENGTH=165 /DNA_ID=CAMNT_0017480259 /DNA_START=216 /DNA_END=714 /DNA_ORIENTATION=+